MLVEIDDKSGFCYGVIRAIEKAEGELKESVSLYSLGDIVHNTVEVNRLKDLGLLTIEHTRLNTLKNTKLLIRAHGEPPSTYRLLKQSGIEIIDCTCPVVLKLQERIKKNDEQIKQQNGQLVIFGKRGHAEVNGLIGQVNGDAIVIENIEEMDSIDFTRPVSLFAQTTMGLAEFEILSSKIKQRMQEVQVHLDVVFQSHNTICGQVANRKPHLEEFARKHDVIVFVSGKQSSNGKVLYQACKAVNEHTYMVEDEGELQVAWFENCCSVGVCGATSTPKWLMEQVAVAIRKIA
ncbi:MAG: 4-hydroxy-3-methylbut-2-enyl diphosphate reductase [Prevotellaceae bacterium]|jgi:4-hydroxy-3-methylbut-2-enyl diphosphate reductase|nr:4-hydroxy-3-methylbut-2-enyl diphosphate reductase [Prevotellaceae bacterium]